MTRPVDIHSFARYTELFVQDMRIFTGYERYSPNTYLFFQEPQIYPHLLDLYPNDDPWRHEDRYPNDGIYSVFDTF